MQQFPRILSPVFICGAMVLIALYLLNLCGFSLKQINWTAEIIALHLAQSIGGAEFYPACIQLNVTGSGNAVPKSSDLLSFPGAYSATDPGIYVPDVSPSRPPKCARVRTATRKALTIISPILRYTTPAQAILSQQGPLHRS